MKIMGMMIFILTNDHTSEEEKEELGDDWVTSDRYGLAMVGAPWELPKMIRSWSICFGVDEYDADEAEGGNGDDNDEDYNGGIAIKCRWWWWW